MTSKPVHAMTPQELADQGIPVEVALRARIGHAEDRAKRFDWWLARDIASSEADAYRDALAIIEAQR